MDNNDIQALFNELMETAEHLENIRQLWTKWLDTPDDTSITIDHMQDFDHSLAKAIMNFDVAMLSADLMSLDILKEPFLAKKDES